LKLRKEEYPEVIPHIDLMVREIDDKVFMNIIKYCSHFVGARAPVFACPEAIVWIID
jgi:hypothetical protein